MDKYLQGPVHIFDKLIPISNLKLISLILGFYIQKSDGIRFVQAHLMLGTKIIFTTTKLVKQIINGREYYEIVFFTPFLIDTAVLTLPVNIAVETIDETFCNILVKAGIYYTYTKGRQPYQINIIDSEGRKALFTYSNNKYKIMELSAL